MDLFPLVRDKWTDKLRADFDVVNTFEACTDREPLDSLTVLRVLNGIPDGTPFVVVFRTVKDDVREMLCIVDTDKAGGKQLDHHHTFTVWDREKEAPRSFRLDRVFSIQVSNR